MAVKSTGIDMEQNYVTDTLCIDITNAAICPYTEASELVYQTM